jgi:hypothetical protein
MNHHFFILCYIHKFIKCNLWIVNWDLQLHANEIKRRVIETLNHVELFVKYRRVLKQFKSLRTNQKKDMKNLNQIRQFFVTWDNFEQIERVKDQRLNNKIKFFFCDHDTDIFVNLNVRKWIQAEYAELINWIELSIDSKSQNFQTRLENVQKNMFNEITLTRLLFVYNKLNVKLFYSWRHTNHV